MRPTDLEPGSAPPRATRVGAVMGVGTVSAHLCQILWLALGARAMGLSTFGAVLAAQALYAVLQTLVDVGPSQVGARLAARGEVDDRVRGALTRTRLAIALPAAAVALGFAAVAGGDTALAVLPFAAALPLFAVLNVWESFGRGEGAPWSGYLLLRSAAPALAAGVCLLLSVSFPPFLAGLVECASIVAVMAMFRLRPLHLAAAARRSGAEPLRSVATIGSVSILFQLTVSSGTLLLSASGANAAAAVLAVGLRFVTGLNSLLGVLSLAIFPRLARGFDDRAAVTTDAGTIGFVLRAVTAAAAIACAAVIVLAEPLLNLFLDRSTSAGEAALVLVLGAAPAAVGSVALSMALTARRAERHILAPFAAGAGIALALGLASLVARPDDPAWMAGAMVAGQLAIVVGLAARVRLSFPELWPATATAAGDSLFVAACAVLAAAAPSVPPLAAAVPVVALSAIRFRAPLRALSERRAPGRRSPRTAR